MSEYIDYTHDVYYSTIEILVENWNLSNSKEIADNIDDEFGDKEFPDLIFNMTNVNYIDSSSIGHLIKLQKKLRVNGKDVILVCKNVDILMTLKVAQLDSFFKIFSNTEQAVKYIEEKTLKK